jgi:hypothetical protein
MGYDVSNPEPEDSGWYCYASKNGSRYLVGASGEPEGTNPNIEWIVQIHKVRSLKEKIFGLNKLNSDDRLSLAIEEVIRKEPDFRNVSVTREF